MTPLKKKRAKKHKTPQPTKAGMSYSPMLQASPSSGKKSKLDATLTITESE